MAVSRRVFLSLSFCYYYYCGAKPACWGAERSGTAMARGKERADPSFFFCQR